MKDIVIIGAGGLGREVAWIIERINLQKQQWNILGFIDDDITVQNKRIYHYSVIGTLEWLIDLKKEIYVVCAIGHSSIRKSIIAKIDTNNNIHFPTVIDPSVIYSDSVKIGKGCIIGAGTIMTIDINIGNYVIINSDSTIGHDDVINDYVIIYPGVNVSGCVNLGECCEIGTGTQIIQGKTVGAETVVGAGTVVVNNLPARCTAVGVPAKVIKFFE